ncbi:hypothetical protein HPP92_020388 [Vanilla planifolia]|uniref:Thioredoxin domain-containing protein n=1 Tax=Vanilla planifolia TaxID=51239 RepID=A0A835Q2Q0_VANPL|nr:hypothetical protein HPP92_020388 [Vanilla planifolia]
MAARFCHSFPTAVGISTARLAPMLTAVECFQLGYTGHSFSPPRQRRWVSSPGLLSGSMLVSGRTSFCCGAVTMIGQSEFAGEVLGSDRPVLVEFVAEWCGPCRLITPVIEWASQEYSGRLKIVKIDHDANPQLIEEYKVYGLPTLILFKNGQEVPVSRREGAITKIKLKEYLESLLGSTTVA